MLRRRRVPCDSNIVGLDVCALAVVQSLHTKLPYITPSMTIYLKLG